MIRYFKIYLMVLISGAISIQNVEARHLNSDISSSDCSLIIEDDSLIVRFDINFEELLLRSNESVVLTPSLILSDGSSLFLPHIILYGRSSYLSYLRKIGSRKYVGIAGGEKYIVRVGRRERDANRLLYRESVPYLDSMAALTLLLDERSCYCDCVVEPIYRDILFEQVINQDAAVLSDSEIEIDSESYVSRILFKRGSAVVDMNYMENREVFNMVDSIFNNYDVESVSMVGVASPLGGDDYNFELSKERLISLLELFRDRYDNQEWVDRLDWIGENWRLIYGDSVEPHYNQLQEVYFNIKFKDRIVE